MSPSAWRSAVRPWASAHVLTQAGRCGDRDRRTGLHRRAHLLAHDGAVLVMTWPLTSASACAWNVPVSVAPAAS
ncbi:MAG: hypothetical protein IPO15_13505 [Anaerolineae bacterium]|uniref:hypothetical protein n=1 Tax=Candidatus Amarolinea dominans TaxID=3140696 RepID=UPI003135BAD9|nr:hypothetical protein [Anaerolineae bacterium]